MLRCDSARVAGVIRHSQASLALLQVRNIEDGEYLGPQAVLALAESFAVPAARQFSLSELGLVSALLLSDSHCRTLGSVWLEWPAH